MLINKKTQESDTTRVKFISYTGEYPCLCHGVLTLEIDGKQYKFGHNYNNYHVDPKTKEWKFTDEDPMNPNFDSFWLSGGSVTADEDWNWDVRENEWEIDMNDLPQQFWDVAAEIDEVFNSNVKWGCCGGCI